MEHLFIYRINGQYLGFVRDGILYDSLGTYLGFQVDDNFWNSHGQFCGQLYTTNGYSYILKYQFNIPPNPQAPKYNPNFIGELPTSLPPINPILVNVGFKDGF